MTISQFASKSVGKIEAVVNVLNLLKERKSKQRERKLRENKDERERERFIIESVND